MKYAVIFGVIATLALFQLATAENISWGKKGTNDQMYDRQIVTVKSKWLQIVTNDEEYSIGRRITYINVIDQYTDGNGPTATLLDGGVGYSSVKLHFKSQRGHGIKFIVEVWGSSLE